MIHFQRPFTHCPLCGHPGLAGEGNRFQCTSPECGQLLYMNVAAATGALIERDGKLLVLRRGKDPGKGKMDFPGGFVDAGESLEDSLRREILEEVGLHATDCHYLCSGSNEYWYQGIQYFTSDAFFVCHVLPGETAHCPVEVEAVEWHDPEALSHDEFAFPSHSAALALWLEQQGQTGRE